MKDYSYLFEQFHNAVVTDDKNDAVKAEMNRVAKENGLTLKFNKLGQGGGACVMPPPNQVNVTLTQGADNKWRVFDAG
jgi:hypothetical protein